ncbi:MAG: hypothetical protein ACI4JC_05695 [Faecalibacterium sp.]
MGYHNDIREKIMLEGNGKSPEYARKKAEDYKKIAATNYRLYKTTDSKENAQSYYIASQNAYAKADAWKEVLALLL